MPALLGCLAALAVGARAPLGAQEVLCDMLVSSRNNHSVKRFDGQTGAYVDDFIPSGTGGLNSTQEIRQTPDGDIIVSGRGNTQILGYDGRTDAFEGAFTRGYGLSEPTKMTWGPDGDLYVSQWGSTHENGVFVQDSHLLGPVNLRWDERGDLQVFDWQSGGVYTYDGQDGSYKGTFLSSLRSPEGWTIGPDGNLYIAEWAGNAIKRFDPETGALLSIFAQGGGLDAPNSVLFVVRITGTSDGLTVTMDVKVTGS